MEAVLGLDTLPRVVRQLPVHPRCFALAALSGRELRAAVATVREELGRQAGQAHGLESARGEAAGRLVVELARDGAIEPLLRLMVAGAPLDLQDVNDETALILAATWGHTEIAAVLIGARAGLNLQNQRGSTALIQAANYGRTTTVAALIKAGAGLDLQAHYGTTALIKAADEGHSEIAAALVEAGAGLDLQDENGITALMQAASNGHVEIAAALIQARASLDLEAENGDSALMMAASTGHSEIVAALKAGQAIPNQATLGCAVCRRIDQMPWSSWQSSHPDPVLRARHRTEWVELTGSPSQTGLVQGVLRLAPNCMIPIHHHPAPYHETYLFTQGGGLVWLGDQSQEAATGLFVEIPAGTPHGVEAGPEGCQFVWSFAAHNWSDIPYYYQDPLLPDRNTSMDRCVRIN